MNDVPGRLGAAVGARGRARSLLVSILTLGRSETVEAQLRSLPNWLAEFSVAAGVTVHVTIRNNDPAAPMDQLSGLIERLRLEHPGLRFSLFSGGPNTGFGRGHNANFHADPADALLILNDDVGFPHIDWLADAMALLERGHRVAMVGAAENPQNLSPFFGNGAYPQDFQLASLKYAEASILLVRGAVFAELGGFDDALEWAMCEDADLSLRMQQHGYRLAWLPMPHQHWRSSTFNTLPSAVRSSMLEHNRATLFATWRQALSTGRVGRHDVFDLWSDGLGDVFCALPHLRAALARMTPEQRGHVVVNTSNPELMQLLGPTPVRLLSCADPGALQAALAEDGISSVRTLRHLNYSLPLNMQALVSGALGLPAATAAEYEEFRGGLRDRITNDDLPGTLNPGSYCVVHLEFMRRGHHGRAMAAPAARALLQACTELFDTVVLVGKERRFMGAEFAGGNLIDLQGRLSGGKLLSLLAHAGYFVGIDSYPSHVAQAAGVRSAIFFGSVHPLTRVWNEARVWPLQAPLDCLGCYHTHVEPSTPFCMRRDEACTTAIDAAAMRETLQRMVGEQPHDWTPQQIRLRQLQAKMVKFVTHHPAPPERLFRANAASNEKVSNLIYQITNQMSELLKGQYATSQVADLTARAAELETLNFAKDVAIEDAARARWQHEGEIARLRAALRTATVGTQVMPLAELSWEHQRCALSVTDDWLDVASEESDPQLFLAPIEGTGGQVQLRLTGIADSDNVLEFFWSHDAGQFSEVRKRSVATGRALASVDQVFLLAEGERLWLRVDPLAAAGRMRLRGTLSGAFRLPRAPEPTETAPLEAGMSPAAMSNAAKPSANGAAHELLVYGEGSRRRGTKPRNGAVPLASSSD